MSVSGIELPDPSDDDASVRVSEHLVSDRRGPKRPIATAEIAGRPEEQEALVESPTEIVL